MKTIIGIALLAILVACGTPATAPQQQLTPPQIGQRVCTAVNTILPILQADVGIPLDSRLKINDAATKIAPICTSVENLTTTDAASLTNLAFNEILPIVEVAHPELSGDLVAAQAIIAVVQAEK